jgi:hypothetical protein
VIQHTVPEQLLPGLAERAQHGRTCALIAWLSSRGVPCARASARYRASSGSVTESGSR